jgi:hypothetical protein
MSSKPTDTPNPITNFLNQNKKTPSEEELKLIRKREREREKYQAKIKNKSGL